MIVPCVRCDVGLDPAMPDSILPADGTAFTTGGHYGSEFDPMDGSRLQINVCDPCLNAVAALGRVLTYRPPRRVEPPLEVSLWNPETDDHAVSE